MGSAMASMPHYLAAGVNELAGSGVERAVHGLMSMLLMTITGVEELLVFYINMLTGTYLCLITLLVQGSIKAAFALAEDVTKALNSTIHDFTNTIADGINDFDEGLDKAKDVFSKISGNGDSKPALSDQTKDTITKLQNFEIPSDITDDLTNMGKNVTANLTFQNVQKHLDNLIRLPFEEVKKLVNESIHFNFNRSLLPVPQKEALTFCSDNNGIADFFEDLVKIIYLARRIFLGVLIVLAILVCIPMAIREYKRWQTMKDRAELVKENSFDPLDVIYIASRPYTATVGIKAAAPFKSTKRQALVRWVIAYATSTPALLVLALGLTGLLSCLCQYILLKAVEKEVPVLANEVGDFAGLVVNKLNNASESWANGTNAAITGVNHDINHNVFGWVNTTTGALNDTINAFMDETMKGLNTTFQGTILYDPVVGIFECIIGLKVAAIQKGLDWVSDNAQVNFPEVNSSVFSLGAANSLADSNGGSTTANSFLSSPGSKAEDEVTNAVVKVANHLADGIRTEAIISTCVVLLWVIILLIGIFRALFLAMKHDKVRAEGGPSLAGDIPMQDRNVGNRGFSTYTTSGPAPAYESPKNNMSDRAPIVVFATPIGHNDSRDSRASEEAWQDEKVGFGGMREPEQQQAPRHHSSYASVEKS